MTIADVMTTDLPPVGPADSIREIARTMRGARVKALPVVDQDRLVGIITDWDITRAMAEDGDTAGHPASRYMSTDLVSVAPDASFLEATQLMSERQIHHLLVSEEGRFRGMVHLDVEWSELGGLEAPMATFTAPI